jgi:hypothetical protein
VRHSAEKRRTNLGAAPVELGHDRAVQLAYGAFHLLLQLGELHVLGLFLFLLLFAALTITLAIHLSNYL